MARVNYSSLFVPALKDLLRERGLKVGGTKQELIDRLKEDDAPAKKGKTPAKRASPAKKTPAKGKSPAKKTPAKGKTPAKRASPAKKTPAKRAKRTSNKKAKWRPDQVSPDNDLMGYLSLGNLDAIKKMNLSKQKLTKYMNMAVQYPNVIKYLVKEGGDPSMGGTNGVLETAGFYGYKDVVKFLLKDKRVQEGDLSKAAHFAKTKEIREMIEEYM
jgi:hypothetical protein